MSRVVAQGDLRPVRASSDAMQDLQRILAVRESEYGAAHYTLDTSGRAVADCVEELVRQSRSVVPRTDET